MSLECEHEGCKEMAAFSHAMWGGKSYCHYHEPTHRDECKNFVFDYVNVDVPIQIGG